MRSTIQRLGQHSKQVLFVAFYDFDGVAEHIFGPVDQLATGTCCLAIGNQGVGVLFGGSRRLKRRLLGRSGLSSPWRSTELGHLDLDDVVLDGVHDQIADGVQIELPHDVATMCFHGLGT